MNTSSPISILTVPSGIKVFDMGRAGGCCGAGTNTPRCTRRIFSSSTSTPSRSSITVSFRPVTWASVSRVTICSWACRSWMASKMTALLLPGLLKSFMRSDLLVGTVSGRRLQQLGM
ncbi:hypothetical protein D9M69_676720 [compost metagenome]